jgi:hypothetical protein
MHSAPVARPYRWPRAALLACAAIALALLPACGGAETKPTVVKVEATGEGRNVEIKAPRSIKGGLVQLELTNRSDGPRDAQLVRVEGDHSAEEFLRVIERQGGPIPDWIQDGGGVSQTDPGQTASATQDLAEGKYIVAAETAGEGGEPATTEMTVEGGGKEGALPEVDAEIVASEYTFDVTGLKPGRQKVLFKNDGRELHHVVGAPINPGRTIEDVRRFAQQQGRPSGPPPIDERSGFSTAVIDGGIEQVVDLNLKKPGKYALLCFIQDRRGGPPHVMKGMIKEVEVN